MSTSNSAGFPKKRKLDIEADLRQQSDDRYKFVIPNKAKSDVWKNFKQVEFEGKLQDYARCNKCKNIVAYSAKGGTSSLLRHKCNNERVPGIKTSLTSQNTEQPLLDKFISQKLPEKAKNEIKMKQVGFITKDLRPISTTEGKQPYGYSYNYIFRKKLIHFFCLG